MLDLRSLRSPWLIAIWPGMGHVALSAGYYLIAQLEAELVSEFPTRELFDVEHVEVKEGIVQPGKLPRSRVFGWRDPAGRRDLVFLLGEAQPPLGKYAYCRQLVDYARELGVERIFTFAAFATRMHPQHASRVMAAATSAALLADLVAHQVRPLEEGYISGLNGLLLGAAAEAGLAGACLLGEMPHALSEIPFPAASLAVLRAFRELSGIPLDLRELEAQAQTLSDRLGEVLASVEPDHAAPSDDETEEVETAEEISWRADEPRLSPGDRARIEALFDRAQLDRSRAFELKQELDRLQVFPRYEDRFLDLFKKTD